MRVPTDCTGCGTGRALGVVSASLDVPLAQESAELERLRLAVEAFATRSGLALELVFPVNLALGEILANIYSYGFPVGHPFHCHVTVSVVGDALTAVIEDSGIAYDPLLQEPSHDPALDADERPSGGLGVFFIKTLLDEVKYERVGTLNRITLTKRTAAPVVPPSPRTKKAPKAQRPH